MYPTGEGLVVDLMDAMDDPGTPIPRGPEIARANDASSWKSSATALDSGYGDTSPMGTLDNCAGSDESINKEAEWTPIRTN